MTESRADLRSYVSAKANGVTLRKGLVGPSLTAEIAKSVEFKFYSSSRGNTRITRDNPFLEDVDAKHLDQDGVVLPGTAVTPDLIAISAISPLSPAVASREASLLAAILGDAEEQQVRDSSSRFDAEHDGYVVASVIRENIRSRPKYTEPGLIDRVIISLKRSDPIAVGDIVEIDGSSVAVVDIVDDDQMPVDEHQQTVDAIVPTVNASFVDKSIRLVNVHRQSPSVRDTVEARSIGPYSLISLMPLKGRGVRGQQVTATEIAWLLENQFPAIAFELASLKCDDTLNRTKLRELNEGSLTFPLETEWGGSESLFMITEELRLMGLAVDCEVRDNGIALRIAPATRDWFVKTAPRTIRKPETINYRSYRPEKEGLFCEKTFGPESHARRERAARFELAAPIVPIVFRIGEQPILSQVLGLDSAVIESIVGWQAGVNQQLQVVPSDDPTCIAKGAMAIQKLLEACDKKLPFDVNSLIQQDVYVIPPDYRPLILLDSGNFATSDLNDLYRRVINRSNRLRKLVELNAPQVILDNEMQELQMCVDQLQANGWKSNPVMGSSDGPLVSGIDLILPRICGEDTKRVDWSGSARAIVDDREPAGQCTLPSPIFDRLRCQPNEPMLLTAGSSFVACLPTRSEELALRLNGSTANLLNLSNGGICIVHRPITTEAVAEAKRMLSMTETRKVADIPAPDSNAQLQLLLSRVVSGEPLVLDTPHLFLLGGAPSLRRRLDEDSPLPEDDIRTTEKPVVTPPSLAELREVAESTERVSCVFKVASTDDEPLPHQGRIGGRPWLPVNVEWPMTQNGEPVPFLAQLPVTPALNESLPFAVDSEMLLTIFWADGWWDAEPTSAPCVLLHSTSELHQSELPSTLQARPLFRLETQLKRHLPHWQDINQLLRCHFDKVPDDLLDELKKAIDLNNRQVLEESRIGGHGYWIQDSIDDFVAQIVDEEQLEFDFGDGGSLFIFGRSPNELAAVVQSH
ncbi:MAG: DUF1963 domain-containing protein [Pirellulaceae bacterium]|nr:DUF1963 domain-containing protein [Pirellulaceae bacterium]